MKIIFIFILCFLLFTSLISFAAEETNTAIGFNVGFGGSGLSYKTFYEADKGIQLTGFIFGDSNEYISYNVGFLYNKVINENKNNRLLFLPGISWSHTIDLNEDDDIQPVPIYTLPDDNYEQEYYYVNHDSKRLILGLSFGIEIKQLIFENISLTVTGGYQFSYISWYFDDWGL